MEKAGQLCGFLVILGALARLVCSLLPQPPCRDSFVEVGSASCSGFVMSVSGYVEAVC